MKIGDKVRLKYPDEHQRHGTEIGIYELYNTDGYVEIKDSLGNMPHYWKKSTKMVYISFRNQNA